MQIHPKLLALLGGLKAAVDPKSAPEWKQYAVAVYNDWSAAGFPVDDGDTFTFRYDKAAELALAAANARIKELEKVLVDDDGLLVGERIARLRQQVVNKGDELIRAYSKIRELESREGHYCIHSGCWKRTDPGADYSCPDCRNAALDEAARVAEDVYGLEKDWSIAKIASKHVAGKIRGLKKG